MLMKQVLVLTFIFRSDFEHKIGSMEERKGGRSPFHAVLNNLEQVMSCGVCTRAEKIGFDLVLKSCLRSAEMEAAS